MTRLLTAGFFYGLAFVLLSAAVVVVGVAIQTERERLRSDDDL